MVLSVNGGLRSRGPQSWLGEQLRARGDGSGNRLGFDDAVQAVVNPNITRLAAILLLKFFCGIDIAQ